MFSSFRQRVGHYFLLTVVGAVLCLPNLGVASLWDMDEGKNATCAYEMYQSGDFILPTFNYQLREDKPVLLYWLQMAAYHCLGVNERSARLPSTLATLVSMLSVYELGRQMFGARVGLLAGLVLGSTLGVCAAGHFANPDALLLACTLMTMLVAFRGYAPPERCPLACYWWIGVWTGVGMLAKGPVALVLPAAACVLFLTWEGQLRRLLDGRLGLGILGFVVTAAPWYIWVTLDSRGQWLRGFLWKHNVDRALAPLENHHGGVWYYFAVLLLGFGLWSAFFMSAGRNAARRLRDGTPVDRSAIRFLLCWIAVYFVFFSFVRTKLPNYVLPLYPAGAILIACLLEDWRRGQVVLPRWFLTGILSALVLAGFLTALGLLLAGGALPGMSAAHSLPGLEKWAGLGAVPLLGAASAWLFLKRDQRGSVVVTITLSAVIFTGSLAAWVPPVLNRYKAPRGLVGALSEGQLLREVRLITLEYSQPSLNFYGRREVRDLYDRSAALASLEGPLETYLFLPAQTWEELRPRAPASARLLGRQHDLYKNCDVVVVGNR